MQALALALVGAAVALIVLAYGLISTRDALESAFARQGELRATQALAGEVLKLQLDEETGIRGYVSTGLNNFLEPYTHARKPLESDLAQLVPSLSQQKGVDAAASQAAADAQAVHDRWQRDVTQRLLPNRKTNRLRSIARDEKALMDRFREDTRIVQVALAAQAAMGRRAVEEFVGRFATFALLALLIAVAAVAVAAWRDARAASLAGDIARLGDFRMLSSAFDRMVWTAKPNGAIDYTGARWTEYAGVPSQQLLDDGWKVIAHPDDRLVSAEAWRESLTTGSPFNLENRMRRFDGEYRWLRHRALPLHNRSGKITAWAGESTDIHEERTRFESLRERYETEKRVADTLQKALLSETLPSVPGLVLDAVYRPASLEARVGGDWYDVFMLPDGRVLFSVGDVAGHGIEAAVAMNQARQVIIATALAETSPELVLMRANATLNVQGAPIVTALCGFLDPKTGEGSYAAAGHPPPLLVGPEGSVKVLQLGGMPLGSRREISYASHAFRLVKDGLLVVYTDGAIEYDRDVLAGELHLAAVTASIALDRGPLPAQRIYREIFAGRQPNDDVAILVIRFAPPCPANAKDGDADVSWETAGSLGV
ncbi:MAG: SpoIIE family protein phosphatase [Vulcanimicrobiaceae bacterium]